MAYRVAILGHSQVPRSIPMPESIQVRIFRRSGARLDLINDYEEFREFFSWEHEHNVIFIGGNDLTLRSNALTPQDVSGRLINLCQSLHEKGQTVSLCQIEPRRYPNSVLNRFYARSQEIVNRRLKNYIRNRRNIYRLINFNTTPFAEGHLPDGVHFKPLIQEWIKDKMAHAILYYRDEYEAAQ